MTIRVPILPLCLLLAGLAPASAAQPPAGRALRLLAENRPLVIAHRGFSATAPENTLPAFQLAMAAQADLVELDYHHTRDHLPVVIHDHTLDRTTDATNRWRRTGLAVSKSDWADLAPLDAGRWFHPLFADTRLLLLPTAVSNIQSGAVTLIERKAGDAASCAALLRRHGWVNEVVVQAFDWEFLAALHQLEPAQVLGALGPWKSFRGKELSEAEKELSPRWVDEAAAIGARAVVWNRQVTREAVEHAHRRGLKVWTYTINDPALVRQLVSVGVDGIISDNPALVWRALATR